MNRLPLKDALFLGFCAVLIISAKAALRFHLKIPGHSMFFNLFFLLLAAGCVRHPLSASFTGLMASIMAVILGMGKGGPLLMINYLLPAVVVDAMAGLIGGRLFESVLLCALTAGLAAASRFISAAAADWLAGMDPAILIRHAALQTIGNVLFGIAGALGVPVVIRKLRAFGAIQQQERSL